MFDSNETSLAQVNVAPRRKLVPQSRVSGVLDPGVFFLRSKPHVIVTCHRYIDIFHADTGEFIRSIATHTACVNDVKVHPVLNILITVASDKRNKVCVHNIDPKRPPPSTRKKRGKWSQDEIELLNISVKRQKHNKKNWIEVAADIPGRTPAQCASAYRWRYSSS